MSLLFQGLKTPATRIPAKAASKLLSTPFSSNKLKQNLPPAGLLQRAIGTILKTWIRTRKSAKQIKPMKGEDRETAVDFRISGCLYRAGSQLDQLFATGSAVLIFYVDVLPDFLPLPNR